MRHHSRAASVVSVLFISALILVPLSAGAARDGSTREARTSARTDVLSTLHTGIPAGPLTLCPTTIVAAGIAVNVFLPGPKDCGEEPPPPPPPVDACPNVPGDQAEGPCADEECVEDGGTWNGTSCDFPPPPPEGKLLITEVLYDLTTTTEQGIESANEWVELYNGTNSDVNLGDYFIADATGSDALPSVVLPAGEYAVISASSTTETFWDIPEGAVIVVLSNSIGSNGLGNDGDAVFLLDAASTTVDSVSWGDNIDAFSPAVEGVEGNSGHSIAREPVTTDTDSAADWVVQEVPTPGE